MDERSGLCTQWTRGSWRWRLSERRARQQTTKRGYGGGDDDDDDDSEEGAQKRWPQNNGQNCFIQCRRRGGRSKNCTHLIYAAAFLPWEGDGGRGAE